ncbi:MAG: hypothetical protein LBP58_01085 [Azoarcus sp.]|jgi:pilus assembly protein FimV|nr:hypothetical protein [Azoarcus sp.]
MKPTIKASLVAAAIALLPLGAQAAGLEQIIVQSRLGEPLDAEIPINATPQELQSLSVRIAPPDAFLQANVPYAGFVPSVKVAIENRGGRSVLKLSSNTPVNEAVASLIIQMNWDDGRISRTYNFLLDPADLAIRSPSPVAPPVAPPPSVEAAVPVPDPLAGMGELPVPDPTPSIPEPSVVPDPDLSPPPPEPPIPPAPELAPTPMPTPEFASPEPPRPTPQPDIPSMTYQQPAPTLRAVPEGEYVVKQGDTLGHIARARMPEDVTLDQMMVALYRANASAFIDNNVNRLKSGAILKMPSADEARAINTIEARREVRVQTRDFNAWRERLAAGVAEQPARATEEGGGRTRGIDTVPPPAEQNRDKVVIASGGDAGQGGDAQRLRQLEEDIAATQSSLKDAKERVGELEALNKNLDALLALRSQELAKLQSQLSGQPTPPTPTPTPAEPVPATPPVTVAEQTPVPVPPQPPAVPETPEVEESAPPTPEVAPVQPPELAGAEDLVEEDPLLELITDPQTLGMGALIIFLLGGFLGFRSWQRKRAEVGLDTLSQDTSMFSSEATSIFGDNGGQSVDTSASSVIHTDFSQTGLSIDTNEGVDPVAEADVYMAYGRDTQAEEILHDALKADPKRGAIYVKLLEIYVQRQDLEQFRATANELYSRTQGQGRDWEKAAQMGRKLDPDNPLYNNNAGGSEVTALHSVPGGFDKSGKLDMAAVEQAASAGATLASLDFGVGAAATDIGQRKAPPAQNRGDDLLTARAVAEDADVHFDLSGESEAANAKAVDFDLGAARAANGAAQPVDFDFDKSAPQTVQAKPVVRQVASVASRRPVVRQQGNVVQAAANASVEAVPLEFDLEASRSARPGGRSVTASIVPSARASNDHAPETSFDPHALDFDLDLDTGDGGAPPPPPSRARGKAPVAPVPEEEPGEVGEIDTKLELARAYEDMGDTEGALELLREVVAEGNATQKATAQTLIEKLA